MNEMDEILESHRRDVARDELYAWLFVALILGIIILAMSLMGCATPGKTACAVVDLAKNACDTLPIRYLGPEGQVVEEHVPAAELRMAAQRSRARRLGLPSPVPSGSAP